MYLFLIVLQYYLEKLCSYLGSLSQSANLYTDFSHFNFKELSNVLKEFSQSCSQQYATPKFFVCGTFGRQITKRSLALN